MPRSACPPGAGRRRPGRPPRSVILSSGSNAWSGRCSCSVLPKRQVLTSRFGPSLSATRRAWARVFSAMPQRDWPRTSSLIFMLVEPSIRKTSEAACFFFSWSTTDGRSAASRQSSTAASRRPSAT